jgi:alpha-galactosidase
VGLFNLGDRETKVVARWDDLEISGKHLVRDLWRQKDVGDFEREYQARVAPHGVVLVRISAQKE